MKECIRCRVVRDTPSNLCPVCRKEINSLDLGSCRTEQIMWGLMLLRRVGKVECDAQHDEFSAGLNEGAKLEEGDHLVMVARGSDNGLNWHYDEDDNYYGFFT